MHSSNDNDFKITPKELKDDISKSFWIHKLPTLLIPAVNCGFGEREKGVKI